MAVKLHIPIEAFVTQHLFEDSKSFFEIAQQCDEQEKMKSRRYIRACIISAFAALEAFVNTSLAFLDEIQELDLAEQAFAQEKQIELTKDGYFELSGRAYYRPLEQKVAFLYWRREGKPFPRSGATWKHFKKATNLRNSLVHPKPGQISYSELTLNNAKTCLDTTVELCETLGGPGITL